ncbi:MAG: hypothetical protein R6U44_03155 [Archaeoglobaceae archaeon]
MAHYWWKEFFENPNISPSELAGFQVKINCKKITVVQDDMRTSPVVIHEGVDNDPNGVVFVSIYSDGTLWWEIGHYPQGEDYKPDESDTYSFNKYIYLRLKREESADGRKLVMTVLNDINDVIGGPVTFDVINASGNPYTMVELEDTDTNWVSTYERGWIDEIIRYYPDGTSEIWKSSEEFTTTEGDREGTDDCITINKDTSEERLRLAIEIHPA